MSKTKVENNQVAKLEAESVELSTLVYAVELQDRESYERANDYTKM